MGVCVFIVLGGRAGQSLADNVRVQFKSSNKQRLSVLQRAKLLTLSEALTVVYQQPIGFNIRFHKY